MARLAVFQSLWATEHRIPCQPEAPLAERFERVKAAGYDGMVVDLGSMALEQARATIPEFARTGLAAGVTAFPRSIEGLRPALHFAKDIGAPFVIVVGQVMPLTVAGMVPVVRDWLRLAAEEGVTLQFETHRNCITNDMLATLALLDEVPELRLAADLSHYVVGREMTLPLSAGMQGLVQRLLDRSDSFQGRVASRQQVQVPLSFPQHRKWLDLHSDWWRRGFASWRARHAADAACLFLCELGPPDYALTGPDGAELSDRWEEALQLRQIARDLWAEG